MLVERKGLSLRRACQITGQHRSTQRHRPHPTEADDRVRTRLRKFSADHPQWGYRRAHAMLRSEGFSLNRKKTQRLWREEGLRVPVNARKRRRTGESGQAADRLRAEHPDHVWALDHQFDVTRDGRPFKILHVVDEFTRESLADLVDRRIDADKTVDVLDDVIASATRTSGMRSEMRSAGPRLATIRFASWSSAQTGRATSWSWLC